MTAAEYRAFQWGVERLEHEPDVVVKLDGDLRLPPQHFATAIARFVADETLGLTGAYLSYELNDGQLQRENHPSDHVRGPNKFYRWSCYQAIQPIEPFPGWEGVDEVKARMRGWRTESFSLEGQDPVHLRPTGVHDGRLRAYRRWGRCAWGYGAHPLHVLLGGIHRFQRRPYIAGGVSYIFGWASAALRRLPRVEDDVLAYRRRQDLADIRRRLRLARR